MISFNWALLTGPAEKMLKQIPNEYIDCVLTSPPYDNVRDYNGTGFNTRIFRKIARELYRVIKPGGTVIWVVGDQTCDLQETGTSFEQALFFRNTVGFLLYDTMLYLRKSPPLTHDRYEQGFEYIFVLTKGRPKTFNGLREPKEYPEKNPRKKNWHRWPDGSFKNGTNRTDTSTRLRYNVWEYTKGRVSESERYVHKHPAVFPEELALDHILSWSNPGDVILDPFCGSGTTAKMALSVGRKFLGIEICPEYVEIAKQRIELSRDKRNIELNKL